MEFPKDLVKRFLTDNWVLMIVKDPTKPGLVQLVIQPVKHSTEPFPGLTDFIRSWIDTDEVVSGTDVCVVEDRKFVTLRIAESTGASEVSP